MDGRQRFLNQFSQDPQVNMQVLEERIKSYRHGHADLLGELHAMLMLPDGMYRVTDNGIERV